MNDHQQQAAWVMGEPEFDKEQAALVILAEELSFESYCASLTIGPGIEKIQAGAAMKSFHVG